MRIKRVQNWKFVVLLFAFMMLPVYLQGDDLEDCLYGCEEMHDLCLEAADDIKTNLTAICDRLPNNMPNNLKCHKDVARIYTWMRSICDSRRDTCKNKCNNE